jgi:predicted nucleic acid-binding protein
MRVFLDTNIILDVLLNRREWVSESANVILRCAESGNPLFIAWHGLATVYYLVRRGRTETEALSEIDKLLGWVHIADAGDAAARLARSLDFTDFEDALQAVCAESCGSDWIVTRNVPDFSKGKTPALTPAEFLAKFPGPLSKQNTGR